MSASRANSIPRSLGGQASINHTEKQQGRHDEAQSKSGNPEPFLFPTILVALNSRDVLQALTLF